MIIGIDASNLRGGGGVTHLRSILAAADPTTDGFRRVLVWGGKDTLEEIRPQVWLERIHVPALNGPLPERLWWQSSRLPHLAGGCDLLFVPGGIYLGTASRFACMSRNLLPFSPHEVREYGMAPMGARLRLLRWAQARTFRKASGLIFLTEHARATIQRQVATRAPSCIIPHGVDESFRCPPRPQRPMSEYSRSNPFHVVYVSIIDLYKHQCGVARGVATLRRAGFPIVLDLTGPAYPPALRMLRRTLDELDPLAEFLRYRGPISHAKLKSVYHEADALVFASTCENMPNILLEGMAAGLPIACSNRQPMPTVLGGGGVLMEPTDSEDIARALRELVEDPALRGRVAAEAYRRALAFSWTRCARETFSFLRQIASQA